MYNLFYLGEMMKKILLLIGITFLSHLLVAQEDEVRKVVENLFLAMRTENDSLAKTVFHGEARLTTTGFSKDNEPIVHSDSVQRFIAMIGQPHDKIWDEQISNVVIQIEDNLAQVWMDYSFYLGEDLLHCGVNAMQLVKTNEGWKIIQLTDTRSKEKCNE